MLVAGAGSATVCEPGRVALGAAVNADEIGTGSFDRALRSNGFTSLTPEGALKFRTVEPVRGEFSWEPADKIVDYVERNGMRVRGHVLLWHRSVPEWIRTLPPEEARDAVRNHIYAVVSRYKGRIAEWDVVNEALADDGELRDSVWLRKLGPDYVSLAFQWAHEADPDARLYYNDFSIESLGYGSQKVPALVRMLDEMQARGVPIHGVGFQMHADGEYPGTEQGIVDVMRLLRERNLTVEVTELDVRASDEAARAARYREIGLACNRSPNCTGVTTWGLHDGRTWLPGRDPLLLDDRMGRKPSYYGLTEALYGASGCGVWAAR
jgi:endo-1,4-beta-xylanase